MAVNLGGDDDISAEINVTPLVDVMLVLLVVFIVTAPLLTNAVRVQLPQTALNAPTEQKPALAIAIDAKGRIFLDKTEYQLDQLVGELRRRKDAEPDIAVHLHGDESSNYGIVAKVMAHAARAGISKLSVLSISE